MEIEETQKIGEKLRKAVERVKRIIETSIKTGEEIKREKEKEKEKK